MRSMIPARMGPRFGVLRTFLSMLVRQVQALCWRTRVTPRRSPLHPTGDSVVITALATPACAPGLLRALLNTVTIAAVDGTGTAGTVAAPLPLAVLAVHVAGPEELAEPLCQRWGGEAPEWWMGPGSSRRRPSVAPTQEPGTGLALVGVLCRRLLMKGLE
jgi:hypothetical protein